MTRADRPPREESELRRQLGERTADLQRLKAEYDNYRKRVRRDRLAVREAAVANVLRGLLPVLDAADGVRIGAGARGDPGGRGEGAQAGLDDVLRVLEAQLGALGLETFGAAGDPFDPALHEALTHTYADTAAGRLSCVEVLRPGYRVGDVLLRPAQVKVVGPPPGRRQPRHRA
ncbi:MAG TPA: nucleotide exchange factor GrpE [Streptomyces sp.]|nr:nucleotide exchange factor GrpE [Streptomyces sp.]